MLYRGVRRKNRACSLPDTTGNMRNPGERLWGHDVDAALKGKEAASA